MIHRAVNLSQLLQKQRSLLLFGPRGVGKTTLIREFLSSQSHTERIDLLHSESFRRYRLAPEQLRLDLVSKIKKGGTWTVAIDEVQRVPELLNEVHSMIEEHKEKLRFVLSGSSARKLKRGGGNLLAGRALTLKLHPLSSLETELDLDRALSRGTLPAIYLDEGNVAPMLSAYVDTYVREEILQESIVRQVEPFIRFLDVAAQSNGEPLTFSKLAKIAGVSPHTIKCYYQILEDTLLGRIIYPFHTSVRRQILQSPKFYFFDCGVINQLRGEVRTELRESSYRYGKLFESLVVNELLCANDYLGTDYRFSYWRTDRGQEVDLVLSHGAKLPSLGIEIKSDTRPQLSDLSGLRAFMEDYPKAQAIVLCRTPHAYELGKIRILPWTEGVKDIERL